MPTVSHGLFGWLFRRGATLEDFADRLNHVWTFGLLLLLACIVGWRHHAESPIHCFPPSQFSMKQTVYVEKHCWNSHIITYNLKGLGSSESVSDILSKPFLQFGYSDFFEDNSIRIRYVALFQWLPLILCFQALLFKLPAILMYILHGYSGISFEKISSLTEGYSNLNMADRQLLGRQTGRYLYNWCLQFKCLPWRLLTIVWLMAKVLFAVNVIVQLVMFNKYLSITNKLTSNSTSYGDVITDNIFENNATIWRHSLVFPRQVLCDVAIRSISNVHRYTMQCDITANDFNETVCMFLWVWLTFVATITIGSLVVWFLQTLLPCGRKGFISKALRLSEEMNPNLVTADHNLDAFSSLVGEDGVMALKLIGSNSSDHVVRDVVCTMWNLNMSETRGAGYQPGADHRL